jgi:beta-glucosidase
LGTHSPGKKDHASMLRPFCPDALISPLPHNYRLAGIVLGNLFKAHIEAYQAIKLMPYGQRAQLSIVHQVAQFDAKVKTGISSALNPLSRMIAYQFNKNFCHETFMRFFTTGNFKYEVPGEEPVEFIDLRARNSLDFIGLNFYADMTFGPAPECHDHEEKTDMAMWAIRPHSLYKTIKEMAALRVPIIITENGICDAKDDRREKWIISYNNAVKQAIDEGYDVRGYCYWSLLDNFEWNMGHNKKFGLYAVDTLSNDPAQKERTLRKGAYAYRDYVRVAD